MNAPFFPFPFSPAPTPVYQQEVPARIRAALSFLQDLNSKTMTRAAVSENDIEEIEGQELSQCEKDTQADACRMLSSYFDGTLKPNCWELDNSEEEVESPPNYTEGVRIKCPCSSPGRTTINCHLCKGSGWVLVFPDGGGQ